MLNKTVVDLVTAGQYFDPSGQFGVCRLDGSLGLWNRHNSDGDMHVFRRNNVTVGSISVTTTNTAYNTSSDRRLKDNIKPLGDVGDIIDRIAPVSFDWRYIEGRPAGIGFVAQDLYKVVPEAVKVGDNSKKAKAGDPKFDGWAVDQSKLMPYVIAELQALRARLAANDNLQARVEKLERQLKKIAA